MAEVTDGPDAATFNVYGVTLIRRALDDAHIQPIEESHDQTLYAGPFRWHVRLPDYKRDSFLVLVDARYALLSIPRNTHDWTPACVMCQTHSFKYGYLHNYDFVALGVAHYRCLNCKLAVMSHTNEHHCLYEPSKLMLPADIYWVFDLLSKQNKLVPA